MYALPSAIRYLPSQTAMTPPRVSILIPNYNNGTASSKDGATDLIGDLLTSLHATLADDPTPLEIIAFDDGSTDDSLETLRDWSQKAWRGGKPFLTLLEDEHCGVLSITANKLVKASQGEILVRLDGDIVIHTRNWASLLCAAFDAGPADLGVIGPKQLAPTGQVHSMGDMLLHPKGYHHVAEGMPPELVNKAVEVDHVMGCFYCCKREVHEALGGFDEGYLRGQTVDFGMRSRLAGYRCWAIPTISFTHRHTLREDRATAADTDDGVDLSRQHFRDKWGFDRIAPDLDAARERYVGTPLLWNANVFGVPAGSASVPTSAPPGDFAASEWVRFNEDKAFRDWTRFKASATVQLIEQELKPADAMDRPVVVPGCGSGLVVHLLALKGIEAIGVEREAGHIEAARRFARQHQDKAGYPGPQPRFIRQTALRQTPLKDGSASLVCLFDRMEAEDNPVSLLTEAKRLTGEGGVLVVSRWPGVQHERPMNPYHPFLPQQLANYVKAGTDWLTLMETTTAPPGPSVVIFSTNLTGLPCQHAPPSETAQAQSAAPV